MFGIGKFLAIELVPSMYKRRTSAKVFGNLQIGFTFFQSKYHLCH